MDPEPNQEPNAPQTAGDGDPGPRIAGVGVPDTAVAPNPAQGPKRGSRTGPKKGVHPNNVKKLRQRAMMSKAELARRAGVSPLTIDRVETGCPCRMDTKRKILEALGLDPSAARDVFPDVDLG